MESAKIFRTILVADDGSPQAKQLVATAFSLAQHYAARVILLWVKTPAPAEQQAEGYGLEKFERDQVQREHEVRQSAAEGRQQGLRVTVAEISGDVAAKEIEKYVDEHKIDLVVVGHRNLSPLRHLLEQSTSKRLLRHTSTAILVIPEEGA